MRHIKLSFFLDLFFKNKSLPAFCKKITNTLLNTTVYETNAKSISKFKNKIYYIKDIPDYFLTELDKTNMSLKLLSAPLYQGYLINLTAFSNLEDYLNNKLGRPRKSQLKRYRKRLDLCIAPEYKIFYGDILKEEYQNIFKELILITKRRFSQKEEFNFELPYLKLYQEMMYPLLLKKQAAIFCIYYKKKPINITLNFIDGDTIFHWNSCYNIDYQMFNLGHINMVNHLEWAYENNFKLFDMGRGDFLHKRKYVNESYIYNENIIFSSKSITAYMRVHFRILKLKTRYQLINFLKKINFHKLYGYYAKYKYKIVKSGDIKTTQNKIDVDHNISKIPELEKLRLIDLNNEAYGFLIKPLNYFLHKTQEFVHDVTIYIDLDDDQTFYFKGTKKYQKLTVIN
ncbi:GNAT family N-acetyltransferase [Flavivirga algicola]|uniref:GNAT family N-acetyltransferase n=1 Tax=Flavivirga algicola TaxID=2729136 RepID=A0ABX1RZ03_9FLAO|nr:GNAT family N-acetyltransferase [Flavivirga algicola]NMH88220.1 GNAT family N-acetyltransferase [Flavivirga algicola]